MEKETEITVEGLEFSKFLGTFCRGPHNQDHNIMRVYIRVPPVPGNYHIGGYEGIAL